MKKIIYTFCILILFWQTNSAQDTFYSLFTYTHTIPQVTINDNTVDIQRSLFPAMYNERSAAADINWVQENDSELVAFWNMQGDTILHILTELAGIEWVESEFDIYLVRYFSELGSASPFIFPLGGIDQNVYLTASPDIQKQKLLLIYYLAKRMLMQANRPNSMRLSISYHPLMQPTPYRLDNLAMLLAVTASYTVLGVDTTYNITSSAFWQRSFPGRQLYEKYLEKDWILTPEQPLADWIANEPSRSKFVLATRTPSRNNNDQTDISRTFVEDLPLKGRFGFAVRLNDAAQPVISVIDEYRLAYACGLRKDDVIRKVDGKIVRNHKQIIEYLLESFQNGGSIVEISRLGERMEVVVQPLDFDMYNDDYYIDQYNQNDSTNNDTQDPNIGN